MPLGFKPNFFIREGQSVKAGKKIELVGNTGKSTAAHLHYEVLLRGWLSTLWICKIEDWMTNKSKFNFLGAWETQFKSFSFKSIEFNGFNNLLIESTTTSFIHQ